MTARPFLQRALGLANALLFVAAFGLAFDHSVASALSRLTGEAHWSTAGGAPIVVVDRTGEAAWQRADQRAVEVWNRAAAGTPLRLVWTAGSGPCGDDHDLIEICQTSSASLNEGQQVDRQGVTRVELGSDHQQPHIGRATVLVCGDCEFDTARRRVVSAHELGHAVGLLHSERLGSVMFHTGGPDEPDAEDTAELRALYAHVDGPDRCGFFDVRAGAFCF
ncbi:MAG TPA: matrixin family metalloprotease [Acidimicrobiales bacterium]|nr:matrixin family metalloprotease [Acidimicrobiales bacterium]